MQNKVAYKFSTLEKVCNYYSNFLKLRRTRFLVVLYLQIIVRIMNGMQLDRLRIRSLHVAALLLKSLGIQLEANTCSISENRSNNSVSPRLSSPSRC